MSVKSIPEYKISRAAHSSARDRAYRVKRSARRVDSTFRALRGARPVEVARVVSGLDALI
jgi:hypothetical protein